MDNEQIKMLLKERINIVVGDRVIKRFRTIIDPMEIDNYTDDAVRTVVFLCQDIKYPFPNESRSKKVMAYRKANNMLALIAKASALGGPEVINNLGRMMITNITSIRVDDGRAMALGIINSGIS